MRTIQKLILLIVCIPAICSGGGTLNESDIYDLLKQKPQIREFILQNFDMPKGAWADIRLGPHYKHLGGKRLGPYTVQVTPKGSSSFSPVVITLCTSYQFLDRHGKVIKAESDEEFEATDVAEKLVGVQLRQASEGNMRPSCP